MAKDYFAQLKGDYLSQVLEPGVDTLPKFLKHNYERWGEREVAYRDKDYGIWNEYTWKDVYETVKHIALGLISLGLKPTERVAIIGDNEPQWYWAFFGIQAARGLPAPMFTDSIPTEIEYVVNHSDSKFIFARDQEQVDKILLIRDKLPQVEKVIWWYWKGMRKYEEPWLMSFTELVELGKKYAESHPGLFEEMVAQGKPEDIAYLFYTSGTTGLPKGAYVSHGAMIGSTLATLARAPINEKDHIFGYLPPAWVGEAFFGSVPHLLTGAKMNTLEEPETVFHDIREICPTFLLGGSRQWEGWVSMIRSRIDLASSVERFIYNLLLPVALKVGRAKVQRQKISLFWKVLYQLVDWVILRALRDRLGLSKCNFPVTAGTVCAPVTLEFMNAIGIPVRSYYGSTEGGMLTGHTPDDVRIETVGPPLPGVEIKIAENSEILVRSPYHFSGYHKNPEATEKAIREGWWYSGDAGYFDDDGHLHYLDRVSELAELRSGVKYAPQYIESNLRFSQYIRDAMTIGEDRDYVACIVNMDFENVGRWAERNRVPYTTFTDLSQKPQVGKLVRQDIDRVNKLLPPETRIKKYALLHKEFDPDEADLTRTRKLRRVAMGKRYADIIEALYSDKNSVPVTSEFTYEDGRKGKVSAEVIIYTVE